MKTKNKQISNKRQITTVPSLALTSDHFPVLTSSLSLIDLVYVINSLTVRPAMFHKEHITHTSVGTSSVAWDALIASDSSGNVRVPLVTTDAGG